MATIELTNENLDSIIQDNNIVVIDFWAPWCGPCKSFAPIFEAVSENHSDAVFAKCNTEEEQDLAGEFQIRSIPTLMIFREQIILFAQPGMLSAAQLEDVIAKVREVDMDQVREDVRKQQEEQQA